MKYLLYTLILLKLNSALAQLPYINWENHPVHALDISPDKTRMALTHTADNRVQLFDISLGKPVKLGSVKVGLDPVSVRFRNNNELWVVNHISDSVSIVGFDQRIVKQTLQTADEPFDLVFANNKVFVSCSQANQIQVFDPENLTQAAVSIDVFAEDPRSMAVSPDGSKVYVAAFESGNKTTILAGGIDESDGTLTFPNNPVNRLSGPYAGQNPPPNNGTAFLPDLNPALPQAPKVSLIIKQAEDERWLDENGKDWSQMVSGNQAALSGRIPGWKLLDRDIIVLDTNSFEIDYISGLMNIGMALSYNNALDQLALVGTDATNEIRFEPNLNGKFLRVNLALVNANNWQEKNIIDLNPHLDYQTQRVPQQLRDLSIGDPRSILWNENGNLGYVTGMGSNNVIVIDNNGNRLNNIEVGEGAVGLGLDESRNRLYVWNHFEASVSVIDTQSQSELTKVQIFNPLPDSILLGRKFLYGTHETSGTGHMSCASCHVDARMDRLAWDLGDPSGDVKEFNQNCQTQLPSVTIFNCDDFHPMKGPMMTQTFQDIIGNEPFHWRGDRNGIEEFNAAFEGLLGDDVQLNSEEMQRFEDMLATITFPPNPFRNLDNSLPESIELNNHYTSGRFSTAGQPLGYGNPQNGLMLFNTDLLDGVFQCASCHTIPTGMAVNGPLMLGNIGAEVGGEIMPMGPMGENHLGIVSVDGSTQKSIKTPQLRNLYDKVGFEMSRSESLTGFGFLHDGAIDSVSRFLSAGAFSVVSDQEVADLVALMMAFSGSDLGNSFIPLGNTPPESQDSHAGVGKQYTLTSATQMNQQLDELIVIAGSERVSLVANSASQNYIFDSSNNLFVSNQGDNITAIGLMALANQQNPLTFTIVPIELENRVSFDRDFDGINDAQEIVNGSNLTDSNSTQLRPRIGLWYNSTRSGHGVDVQISHENMFIIWYTYNDDGTPTWYFASDSYSPNWQADLYSFTWDAILKQSTGTIVGRVQFDFTNARTAQFSWDINGRLGSEPFNYFNTSASSTIYQNTGIYYDPTESGWGLSIDTQGTAQVAVVYYYDENGLPRWSLGSTSNSDQTSIEMLSFTGFCPDCEYQLTQNTSIGSLDLIFIQNRMIQVSTQLDYPENLQSVWQANNVNFTPLSDEFFDPALE
jgi:DNA-binding beta-propeller fold protein YncE